MMGEETGWVLGEAVGKFGGGKFGWAVGTVLAIGIVLCVDDGKLLSWQKLWRQGAIWF